MLCKKSAHLLFLLSVLVFAFIGQVRAEGALAFGQKDRQTIDVLKEIKSNNWSAAHNKASALQDPLTNKLYLWLYFIKGKKPVHYEQLTAFIQHNRHWPKQRSLLLDAEELMPPDKTPAEIAGWFSVFSPRTPDGMARYIDALLVLGQQDKARQLLSSWWHKSLLRPDEQRRFLEAYDDLLTLEDHKKRFDYLLFQRHYTNARALAKIIGDGYLQLAEARIALAEQRSGVDAAVAKVPAFLHNDPGLLYERLRWRRRHNMNYPAIEILHNAPPAEKISNLADWWTERHILARRLIEAKQYESAYLLVDKHMQKEGLGLAQAHFLAGFLALRYMEQPWRAFEHFEALYYRTKTPISRARGAYWAGLASEKLAYKDVAQKWYMKAARHQTTFYGQYALSSLGKSYQPAAVKPPDVSLDARRAFEAWEIVRALKLLHAAGMKEEAELFFSVLEEKSRSPAEYRLSAELAGMLEYHHKAVAIVKAAYNKQIILTDYAYPTLLKYMEDVDIEWALVHGVIRQESAFNMRAESPAGARGLMQLMPATAREVAHKMNLSHHTGWLTSRPGHNIRLGVGYMAQMLDRYDGSYPLAIAAYNAGPGRVDRWLKEIGDPRKGTIDLIDWAELIPVYETRNYVQRVLEATYVYRLKFKDIQKTPPQSLHIASQ